MSDSKKKPKKQKADTERRVLLSPKNPAAERAVPNRPVSRRNG